MDRVKKKIRKKWLITGVAGFIGTNLAEFLLERGQEVFGLDNFSTGKVKNIERLKTRFKRQFFFYKR